jgi:hypothetical protein
MRIDAEPRSATLVEQAAEVLAAKGLRMQEIAPGHYVVTRATSAVTTPAADAAERAGGAAVQLDEVAIYGSRYSIDGHGFELPRAVSHRQVEQEPGARNDVLRATQTLPGVATAASSQPYIRGSLPEDVLVSFDRMAIADPFHLQSFQRLISVFDSSVIERIDVYGGGFPVQFGTRTGGVIEVVPRSVRRGREYGIDIGLQSIGTSTVGHAEHLPVNWLLSLRGNIVDLNRRAVGSGNRQTKLLDLIGRVRWDFNDANTWTAGALMLNDRVRLRNRSGEESAFGLSRDAHFWLIHEWRDTGPWQSRTHIDFARESLTHTALTGSVMADENLVESRHFETLSLNNEWIEEQPAGARWNFGAGVFLTRGDNYYHRTTTYPQTGESNDVPVLDANGAIETRPREVGESAFVSYRPQLGRLIELELGARLDAQQVSDQRSQAQWSPRLNVRWHLIPQMDIYGSIGRFSQAQRLDEWRLEEGQSRADPAQLVNQTTVGVTLGGELRTQWRLEAYDRRWLRVSPYFDNLLNPQSLTPALAPDRIRISPTSATARGIELSVRRDLGRHFDAWTNFSLAQVTDDIQGISVPRSWDQRWSANAGIEWTNSRLSVYGVMRAHQGWPRTPLNVAGAFSTGGNGAPAALRNSARWGTYATADVRAVWSIPLRSSSLELWTELINAANRSNDCCSRMSNMSPDAGMRTRNVSWQQREIDVGLSWRMRSD